MELKDQYEGPLLRKNNRLVPSYEPRWWEPSCIAGPAELIASTKSTDLFIRKGMKSSTQVNRSYL